MKTADNAPHFTGFAQKIVRWARWPLFDFLDVYTV
jgi:hypothetical protein